MGKIALVISILALSSTGAIAQRTDGCSGQPTANVQSNSIPTGTVDRSLQAAGYTLSSASLVSALSDIRAGVRSLAALKLREIGGKSDVLPLPRSWAEEKDPCTKAWMSISLAGLTSRMQHGPERRRFVQARVTPFQPCVATGPRPSRSCLWESFPGSGESATISTCRLREPIVSASAAH